MQHGRSGLIGCFLPSYVILAFLSSWLSLHGASGYAIRGGRFADRAFPASIFSTGSTSLNPASRPVATVAAPLAADPDDAGVKPTPRAWTWAALMHRAFAIDVLACPHCGGRLRLIATLHDPAVIRKILAHVGVGPSGPSPGPAPPKSGAATP